MRLPIYCPTPLKNQNQKNRLVTLFIILSFIFGLVSITSYLKYQRKSVCYDIGSEVYRIIGVLQIIAFLVISCKLTGIMQELKKSYVEINVEVQKGIYLYR